MDLQEDLIQRKNEIEKISAYTSLRKGLALLIKLKKIAVLISMIFLVIVAFQHKHPGATLLQILVTLASTAILLIFLRVTEFF
ncbi:hypothetical protein LNTAR_11211 [Lentisphaera araneosa HTCC2155]|uniref:Uncharacterized protein n=1 Tax=Lentisphaera araneosa HTCC2155 TaxID=313628 RepID=A6DJ45_9BACT|nr:hypothetical protein [Lentisphaera araneosa]EDM28481.1 hypothetical protein LNTAR_11211 [Lentisphaera araneosa HTCC2155]